MYRIRRMQQEDIKKVHVIEMDTFSTPWSEKAFLDELKNEHTVYVVIEKEDEIVAYGGLWSIVGEGHITNIAVKRTYRGLGLGRKVTEALIDQGKKMGIRAYTLEVRKSNTVAIGLYETLGFIKAGVRKNFYDRPKEDAYIMWKRNH